MNKCSHCREKIESDNVIWFHIPGNPGRRPFCSEDCKKAFIYKEMEYHKDILAELESIYGEM